MLIAHLLFLFSQRILMRILLFGEYSNVHATLALGLRELGHEVIVVSDGDGWKDYPRDIDLSRNGTGFCATIKYLYRIAKVLRTLSKKRPLSGKTSSDAGKSCSDGGKSSLDGEKFSSDGGKSKLDGGKSKLDGQYAFDVIHFINPLFLELKPLRVLYIYRYLRRLGRVVTMGAYGMDYYWIKSCIPPTTFRYSDFYIGETPRQCKHNEQSIAEWYNGEKAVLTQEVAADVDGIVSGLYEYDVAYRQVFGEKTRFIPFPIVVESYNCQPQADRLKHQGGEIPRFFIGIQKLRSEYKGTDVMLRALERAKQKYPSRMAVLRAENVPFEQYKEMFNQADVLLDQLYSYTPAMGALQAMAQGVVVIGGGEPENYEILGETDLRPIINVLPDEDDVFAKICYLVEHPEVLPELKSQGLEYIKRHHDHIAVAQKYLEFWQELM